MTHGGGRPAPEPGWTPLPAPHAGATGPRFVSADPNGDRIRIHYFSRTEDSAVVAQVWFGPGAQGPPGHAHGGSIAAVFDEAMALAARTAGRPVLAGKLAVRFSRSVPLGQWMRLEATVGRHTTRAARTAAHLCDADGLRYAEATGFFVHVGHQGVGGAGEV